MGYIDIEHKIYLEHYIDIGWLNFLEFDQLR
jgi:hypothetical protein